MPRITARAARRSMQPQLFGMATRQGMALAAVGVLLWLLQDRFAGVDLANVQHAVMGVRPAQWALAGLATAASFWAVGRYDAVLHGVLGTGISASTARRAGMVAIGTAQFAGFGVLTGALVRWRMIAEMSLWQATRMSLAVSVSFLAGWAVFTALVLLIAPTGPAWLQQVATFVMFGAAAAVLLSLWQPWFLPRLPSVSAMAAVAGLAVLDTSFAFLALFVLLPPDLALPWMVLAPAFLLALGAGLVGGTPGGVGPFELTLLALLPWLPADPLLGAALAFRLVYYVAPAAIAAIWLMRGPLPGNARPGHTLLPAFRCAALPPELEAEIWNAPLAEAQLIRQAEFGLLRAICGTATLAAVTGQSLVTLRQPLTATQTPADTMNLALAAARQRRLSPLLYKCTPRQAVAARQRGWAVLPVSDEAVLNPAAFDLAKPACRQLRRMLRKAEAEGVIVTEADHTLPLETMADISADWAGANGGERGFSMGRFDADYLRSQRVFLAHAEGQLVAFASFNEVAAEWSLDLMRQTADTPDGTMHLLVAQAIARAGACGSPRLSLAAVPRDTALKGLLPDRLQNWLTGATGATGLRRFKSCFAPSWEPLYAAGPNRFRLTIGLAEVARSINSRKRR
ncbi:MAG: phosphatidylglycerol lysyltransferase domain-containing protein [Paracoccaceae bacterium]